MIYRFVVDKLFEWWSFTLSGGRKLIRRYSTHCIVEINDKYDMAAAASATKTNLIRQSIERG